MFSRTVYRSVLIMQDFVKSKCNNQRGDMNNEESENRLFDGIEMQAV